MCLWFVVEATNTCWTLNWYFKLEMLWSKKFPSLCVCVNSILYVLKRNTFVHSFSS